MPRSVPGRPAVSFLAVAVLVLALVPAASLHAQQRATTAAVAGTVTAEDGRMVGGVLVLVVDSATGFRRDAVTDDTGRYLVPLLPPGGPYVLTASSIGYQDAVRGGLRLAAGERVTVDVVLGVSAVRVAGIEVVGASRTQVDRGGVVQVVDEATVERMPVRGRNFIEFLNLSPLVSGNPDVEQGGQFSIAGARASGTTFQVDGADAGNLFFGEAQGSARTPFAYSLEAIRELQVITNGFDVEYANYQGGVVNAVTRGGTNSFAGSGFYFHRAEAITGAGFDREPATDYRTSQFGVTASGPLVRDRLHWFLSADLHDRRLPLETLTAARAGYDEAAIAGFGSAFANQYATPAGAAWVQPRTGEENNAVLFGRLDWNPAQDHHVVLRHNYADFSQGWDRLELGEALTHGGVLTNALHSTVLELNSVLGAGITNSLRVQYSSEDRQREPLETGGYLPELFVTSVPAAESGNYSLELGGDPLLFRNHLKEGKLQLVDNVTFEAGRHALKFGTSSILSSTRFEYWAYGNGRFEFANLAAFAEGQPHRFTRRTRACPVALVANAAGQTVVCPDPDEPVADFDAMEWSVYAQDEWRATDALTVTAGLRFGGTRLDRSPQAVPEVEAAFGVSTTEVPDFTALSPRLAFSLEMDRERALLLRGGVGLIPGRAPLVLAANAFETERPLRQIMCTEEHGIPTVDVAGFLAAERGRLNPAACLSGAQREGRPEYTLFSEDFQLPRTLKANIGVEGRLDGTTAFSLDVLVSRTENNYTVRDLNLRDPQGTIREAYCEGCPMRPVFVPSTFGPFVYRPYTVAGEARLRNLAFDRVYLTESAGEARGLSVTAEVRRRLVDRVDAAVRYAWTRAYDNSTFACCTSFDGFGLDAVAGGPNELLDPGDDRYGTWGPSSNERRHVIVASAMVDGPWGISVDGVLRMQSGTPWTPAVDQDINGDGVFRNERPFLSEELYFVSEEDARAFIDAVTSHVCLERQLGSIATRNSCRNPWWNSLDLRLSRAVETWRGQRAEVTLDFFNLLNGLHWGMGQYAVVAEEDRVLLIPRQVNREAEPLEGYEDVPDAAVIYEVNPNFGRLRSVGFEPYQFQLQLGIRYRF